MTDKRVGLRRVVVDPTRQWLTAIGVAVAVGVAFFLGAQLGLFLLTKPDGVAVSGNRGGRRNDRSQSVGRQDLGRLCRLRCVQCG